MLRRVLVVLALLTPLLIAAPATAGAPTLAPANGRLLFVGQSTKAAWDDYTSLEFHAGSATGPVIAAPGLLGTGDWRTYKEISFNVSNLPAGTTSITAVVMVGYTADVLDLDWFEFV